MSRLSELAYDIEQLYIEGYSPKGIAAVLNCPIDMIYDWLDQQNLQGADDEQVDAEYST